MLKCCGEITAAGNDCSTVKAIACSYRHQLKLWLVRICPGSAWSWGWTPAPLSPQKWGIEGKALQVSRHSVLPYMYCTWQVFSPWLALKSCLPVSRALAAHWQNFPSGIVWGILAQVSVAEVGESVQGDGTWGLIFLKVTWKLLRSGECFSLPPPPSAQSIDGKCSSPVCAAPACSRTVARTSLLQEQGSRKM